MRKHWWFLVLLIAIGAARSCNDRAVRGGRRRHTGLNCLATSANGLMFGLTYELARESAQYFRGAAGNIYPADYFAALRRQEVAGVGARHGQGDQGVPKGQGRIRRRVAQVVKDRYGRIQSKRATGAINGCAR